MMNICGAGLWCLAVGLHLGMPNWNSRGELFVLAQFFLLALIFLLPNWFQFLSLPTIGILLSVLGWAMLIVSALSLGKNLTALPKPKEQATLVTTGLYNLARHPIYGGLLLLCFGTSVWHGNALALLLSTILGVLLEFKSRREEIWLRQQFRDYAEYAKRVKKFIPFVY